MIKAMNLSQALSRKGNNFDLVRLVAAILVVWCHAYLMQPNDPAIDPLGTALGFDGLGSLGVYAFFLMSGILVTASYDRQRSAPRFIALRVARLWPAVAGGSLFAIFVIGPLFTTLPLSEYFASHTTWMNLDNASTLAFKRGWVLPGVFEHNRFERDICAPLWTLPLEVRCYLIVLVAGVLGLLSSRRGVFVAVAMGLVAFAVRVRFAPFELSLRDFSEKAGGYSFWPELFFMGGMLLYSWRDRVHINGLAATAFLMIFLVFRDTAAAQPLFYVTFVYGVLWTGSTPALRRFVPRNDYSFGIYIYGFMMQQSVASVAPHLNHVQATLVAAPFILLCAAASWHFVERPVLAWCRGRLARETVHPVPAIAADSAAR
jgi:peptidoglycan/LPS O-acetylase OafA/YrhL